MTKRITKIEQAAIDAFIATKEVTVVEAPTKEKKVRVTPISTGDSNFDLYCNALPKPLRQWAAATKQDVRGLYKEYRTLKASGMIAKYGEAAAASA